MESPLMTLKRALTTPERPLGSGIGPVASWEVYDLSQSPRGRPTMNSRVVKYTSLMRNLTKMLTSVLDLGPNTYPKDFSFRSGFDFGFDFHSDFSFLSLASRLTWIVMYFYGAMSHYSRWIFNQTQAAPTQDERWREFLASLGREEHLIDDAGQQQVIPTEAPLELVVHIHVARHRTINRLHDLDVVLRRVAEAYDFPAEYDHKNHDGFSNCIFVTQSSSFPGHITVGSTGIHMGNINIPALNTSFASLRGRRFVQGEERYDQELRARFRNEPDTELTTPERRYRDVGHTRDSDGAVLAQFAEQVRTRLTDEYAGRRPTPGDGVLPLADRKIWAPFSYVQRQGRAYFAPFVHANQNGWFEPTPRCMKCRVIHDYYIENEDLQVRAAANKSCQCAEDIVYVKLRQMNSVQNVVLL